MVFTVEAFKGSAGRLANHADVLAKVPRMPDIRLDPQGDREKTVPEGIHRGRT